MALVYAWGAELGDKIEAAGPASTGTPTFVTTNLRTGSLSTRAARLTSGAAFINIKPPTSTGLQDHAGKLNLSNAYQGIWFKSNGAPSVQTTLIQFVNNENFGQAKVEMKTNGALEFFYRDGSNVYTSMGSSGSTYHDNVWHLVEIKILLADTAGSSTVEWKLNTVSQFSLTNLTLTNRTGTNRQVGWANAGAGVASTVDFTWDDYYVDDTGYLGPTPGVGILWPTSAGNSAQWTTGTGSTFAEVDEVPHDTDTTYIGTSTTAQLSSFNVENFSTKYGSNYTIGAVWAIAVVRDEINVSSIATRLKSGATNSNSSSVDPADVYSSLHSPFRTTDPNTSAAWTITNIDAVEAGVVTAASVAVRATQIAIMVVATNEIPSFTAQPSPTYANSKTRTGPNTTWGVTFTAKDLEETAADALDYQIRTSATPGGGTLISSGTCTSATSKVITGLAYSIAGLAQGSNTLYVHVLDATTTGVSNSFTLLRDDSISNPVVDLYTPTPVIANKQYTVQFDLTDTYSTSGNEMIWEVRTAASGGGDAVNNGTFTQGTNITTSTLTDSVLAAGNNNRYLRCFDGADNVGEILFVVELVEGHPSIKRLSGVPYTLANPTYQPHLRW